jgi:hypothetical protein
MGSTYGVAMIRAGGSIRWRAVRLKSPENPYGSGPGLFGPLPPEEFSEVLLVAKGCDL